MPLSRCCNGIEGKENGCQPYKEESRPANAVRSSFLLRGSGAVLSLSIMTALKDDLTAQIEVCHSLQHGAAADEGPDHIRDIIAGGGIVCIQGVHQLRIRVDRMDVILHTLDQFCRG